ncbi:MAG: nucleotide pyrophosphatase [Gammaproteobacteria bacterium]|nr:nucleotide pyrophosphatase [Gammaproteobacteria bacterium]
MHPTLLIGLDGATYTILEPLMKEGYMPFLKEFTESGFKAGLLSTPNPLTPPAWTTIMTGRTPGNHGVFDFIWAEQRKSDHYFTISTFKDIKCETIWSIVSRNNGRAGTLNYPLMAPPPSINGYVVPGLTSWRHLRRHVHPRELYDEMKEIPNFSAQELAWDFDMEKKAAMGIAEEEYIHWAEYHIRRERQWFEVTMNMMKNHPCDLTSILFDGPDKMMHMGWRFLDPDNFTENPTPFDLKMRELCLEYYSVLDGFLAELVGQAGPDARVFMASDHGFGPSWEVFRVNTWLASEGYLHWREIDENMSEQDRKAYEKLVDTHFVLLNWDKTTAYARTTSSNGIFIQVANEPGEAGVPADEYYEFRQGLINKLEAITDPESGERIVKDILLKEEVFPGENDSQAPDLTLVMRDHSFVSILNKEPIVCPRPEIEGTHYPVGVFMGRGPGIKQGVSLPTLSITDVAPTVLYSLGLDIPSDFENPVPTEIFETEHLEANPVRIGDPTLPLDAALLGDKSNSLDSGEEEQIIKQMKALGYME